MYILITGICGLIGSNFSDWVLDNLKGVKIIGIDNDMRSYFFGK